MSPTVAFIGLGAMGYPLAGHLAGHFETLVHNRTPAKAEQHAAEHGTRAVSLEEAAGADVVITCVPVSRDVDDLARAAAPHLKAGTLWIDHTSGEPAMARATAALLAERGVAYLDAPLSGGVAGAVAAKATVMAGGTQADFDRALPIMSTYASTIVLVGPLGAGHAVKAINNALLAVNLWALGEGLVALVTQGVDPALALQVINASSGRSNVTENLAPTRIVTREFTNTFALGLLAKDLGIANQVFADAGTPAPLLRQLREFFEIAKRQVGSSDVDHTAVVQLIEAWAGVQIATQAGSPE